MGYGLENEILELDRKYDLYFQELDKQDLKREKLNINRMRQFLQEVITSCHELSELLDDQ